MFATISRRIASWVSKKDRVYLLLGVLCLLGSVTLTAHALLTVSNSGLLGDGAVTIDGAGVLNLGTASSTAVVIGNSGIPVTIPGTLTLGSASRGAHTRADGPGNGKGDLQWALLPSPGATCISPLDYSC